jgi:hypothetical protein
MHWVALASEIADGLLHLCEKKIEPEQCFGNQGDGGQQTSVGMNLQRLLENVVPCNTNQK